MVAFDYYFANRMSIFNILITSPARFVCGILGFTCLVHRSTTVREKKLRVYFRQAIKAPLNSLSDGENKPTETTMGFQRLAGTLSRR